MFKFVIKKETFYVKAYSTQ